MTQAMTSADSISDARIVDYILRVSSVAETQQIERCLEKSTVLQERLAAWEAALFQLNRETAPQSPPKQVWDNIEKACFTDSATPNTASPWWARWGRFAVPALLAISLVWVGSVMLSPQGSTYSATFAMASAQPIWEVHGNAKEITFVSVKNIAMDGMNCVAWVERDGIEPILLGAVPDTGEKVSKAFAVPDGLNLQAGDRVIVGMVPIGAVDIPPAKAMMPLTVVLAAI